jgi:tripartite-type tricarboxylate transporter receptor subunit TctC
MAMMLQARILSFALLCVAMLLWSAPASPQAYPVRSIRLVVPFPAGGPSDFLSRVLGQGMSAALGQQIVLENRTGAGGLTGVDSVAKSTPDGYIIGITSGSVLAAMPFMTAKFPFDWRRDLSLLTLVARVHAVLAVHPSLPINTLQELVAYAKSHPRKITFGSSGAGTFTHLVIELLMMQAKIELVHVPYRGAAPAVNDLIGGHIDMVAVDVSALLPHIRSGAIKALAVTSATRSDALPGVPTTSEAGFADVRSDNWYGLIAPAVLPAEAERRLRDAAISTLGSAELKEQFATHDAVPSPSTPEEFTAFVQAEQVKWGPVVTAVGIKLD